MDFSPRILAFLEYEMEQIRNDPTRDMEDREHASTVLGRIEGEFDWENQQKNDLDGSEFEVSKLLS